MQVQLLDSHSDVAPAADSVVATAALPDLAVPMTMGSTPVVTLPPARSVRFDRGCPPILVADDDADDTFFIQRAIKKTGVRNPVVAFDDGSEVANFLGSVRRPTASLKHRPPLLLFLDLKMKGLGGFDFLEWARQQKTLAPLTIVILSHTSEPEAMARAMALGAHRYLVKYPSVQTFASIVHSVFPQTVF
ncbi:MAG: response regulator [Opitutaceae bacterium]|nr:response regulator [Opitutaceae bacterium]